jgi:Spy/CpxP family protein refolding chaperone
LRAVRARTLPLCFAALLPAFAAAYASSVAAQPPGALEGRRHHGRPLLERILERHADRLGLDEKTRERIDAITTAAREEGRRIHDRLRESRQEMHRLLAADDPDESAVMRQAEKIGGLETEAQKHRLRTMLQVRALLTPEQRRTLVQIHAERRARRGFGPPARAGSQSGAEKEPE